VFIYARLSCTKYDNLVLGKYNSSLFDLSFFTLSSLTCFSNFCNLAFLFSNSTSNRLCIGI
jgi:hypothetical protein